ncbi:protein Spt2p [Trichomonascus vanleenenianus]|uniref:Spt2p n=1 Tax=Trichomonascus vanleenenianus TaxID=2268995 RepID=UPI003EC982E4
MSFMQMLSMASGGSKGAKPPTVGAPKPPATASSSSSSPALPNRAASAGAKPSQSVNPQLGKFSMSEEERREQQKRIDRLKAERMKERAAKEAAKPAAKAKTAAPRKPKKTASAPPPSFSTSRSRTAASPRSLQPAAQPAKKKLSYAELMKQAESVDSEGLKVTVKSRPKKDEKSSRGSTPSIDAPKPVKEPVKKTAPPVPALRAAARPRSTTNRAPQKKEPPRPKSAEPRPKAAPAPFSKPMPKLLEKQKRRQELERKRGRHYDDEDDDDLDDFVVDEDDEELEEDRGYDRDEIWKILGRGRRAPRVWDEEDDLSDMEATGDQVLEEERRSALHGKRDDEAEEQELARRAKEKQLKKRRL